MLDFLFDLNLTVILKKIKIGPSLFLPYEDDLSIELWATGFLLFVLNKNIKTKVFAFISYKYDIPDLPILATNVFL